MRKLEKRQILKNVGSSWSALAINVIVGIFISPFILHRLEGGLQRLMERRAPILRDGLVRHQERKHFRLRNRHRRQALNRRGVIVAVAPDLVFDWQIQPAFHEVHVALGGAGRDSRIPGPGRCNWDAGPAAAARGCASCAARAVGNRLQAGPAAHVLLEDRGASVESRVSRGECRGASVEGRVSRGVASERRRRLAPCREDGTIRGLRGVRRATGSRPGSPWGKRKPAPKPRFMPCRLQAGRLPPPSIGQLARPGQIARDSFVLF